jgi:hypothetical protein
MFVIGTEVVERHFKTHVGHKGIKATRTQFAAGVEFIDENGGGPGYGCKRLEERSSANKLVRACRLRRQFC